MTALLLIVLLTFAVVAVRRVRRVLEEARLERPITGPEWRDSLRRLHR